ncbi:MAG: hypothetical protein JSW61_02360 [Candidatus Thorarchaeota archaeon]|nr:MAG: hypothetical protein JSW61_02360 [Candidatus Thorarchaeota archaeon]
MTLRLAGTFQEVRDIWSKRLESYFSQLESLIDGQWLDATDMRGIIKESRLASREAMEGLGNDLSSELVHATRGIAERFDAERISLRQEIDDLRQSLGRALSGDESSIRRENEAMRSTLLMFPEFCLLTIVKKLGEATYEELGNASVTKKGKLRGLVKSLAQKGFVTIDKKRRPHRIVFISSPWA